MADNNPTHLSSERPAEEPAAPFQRPRPESPHEGFQRRHHASVEGIVTLLDWLLVAFILALVFQAFGLQAFQIPTGSMAETLRGEHYRMRCLQCGYAFDIGSDSLTVNLPQCPVCGFSQPPASIGRSANGDRIFVLKCIYQFFKPSRWDVVVFKNPLNPKENYIKRLIGLPRENVQIIDGDIYIDGKIARKPTHVQEELWMPIFLQHYPQSNAYAGDKTETTDAQAAPRTHFVNEADSAWLFERNRPSRFVLDAQDDTLHTFFYNNSRPNEFRSIYGYNDSGTFSSMPMCSDLMIRFWARGGNAESSIGAVLEKYGVLYGAKVDLDGAMSFLKYTDGHWVELRRTLTDGIRPGVFETFEFANVDHHLVLRWGQKRFSYELVNDNDLKGIDQQVAPPQVKIFGSGSMEIRSVGLYRDIYYLNYGCVRATNQTPFELNDNEYFVCGDNSPNSLDSRLWSTEGLGNYGIPYRAGIVPHDYLMGKAVMVYWSQAFCPRPDMPPLVPNLNTIKLIFGGSEQVY